MNSLYSLLFSEGNQSDNNNNNKKRSKKTTTYFKQYHGTVEMVYTLDQDELTGCGVHLVQDCRPV